MTVVNEGKFWQPECHFEDNPCALCGTKVHKFFISYSGQDGNDLVICKACILKYAAGLAADLQEAIILLQARGRLEDVKHLYKELRHNGGGKSAHKGNIVFATTQDMDELAMCIETLGGMDMQKMELSSAPKGDLLEQHHKAIRKLAQEDVGIDSPKLPQRR